MNQNPLVIAHIHVHGTVPEMQTEPQSNFSTLSTEMAKFLDSRHAGLSKRLSQRSSFRSLMEKVLDAKITSDKIENPLEAESREYSIPDHRPGESTESLEAVESTRARSLLPTEVWEDGNVINVNMTRVSMLQAMEQSPLDSWDSTRLCHFVEPDGLLENSRKNFTELKEWWDRPLWAWSRNELVLGHGAMLAVEMVEHLKSTVSPTQKLKVAVSNVKKLPKEYISGEQSYRILPFGDSDGWYRQEETRDDRQTESNSLSVPYTSDRNSTNTTEKQQISEFETVHAVDEKILQTSHRVESPIKPPLVALAPEPMDLSTLKRSGRAESSLDDKSEFFVKEDSRGSAKVQISQELDSNGVSLIGSKTSTIALEHTPVTLSPEDSIANEDADSSQDDLLDSSCGTTKDLKAAGDKTDLLTTLSASGSEHPASISPYARKSLITTPVTKCERNSTVSYESSTESPQCETTNFWHENDILSTASDGTENPIRASSQMEKLQSVAVSPPSTQDVEEGKSPQLDSQGIDLSILSQIPPELRSEARLAFAVRQPRKTRKRFRPPTDSHLYKWLSSSQSSVSSKVPRTDNHILHEKRRPNNIKDFFPTA